MPEECCNKCGATAQPDGQSLLHCPGVCEATYCTKECQCKDWTVHKNTCATYQSNLCWICKQSSREESRLYRSCSCRVDKGFVHVECLVKHAKENSAVPYVFELCQTCRVAYRAENIMKALTVAKFEVAQESGDGLETIKAKTVLGRSLCEQAGRMEDALQIFAEVLQSYQDLYGERNMFVHFDVAEAGLDMASMLNMLGRHHEAIALLDKMDAVLQSGRARWRQWDGNIANQFAQAYANIGLEAQALSYAERAVQFHRAYLQRTNDYQPALALAMETQARLMFNMGRREEGIATLKEGHKIMKKAMGSTHPLSVEYKGYVHELEELARRVNSRHRG